ncbi:hypothetical protein H2203_003461 [Taxawa tesnikishii (nom. ined.)]|nr:hypothetical protein H2203_003461 [Dothideales sp. JES 119]
MEKLRVEREKALLFGSAAAVRLLLAAAFPALPDLLTGRVEISTPVTSFKRLQEGLFLYNHGLSPYDGGVFHQAPLFLPLFSLLPDPSRFPLATVLLYTVVDLLSANALMQIAESGEASNSDKPAALAPFFLRQALTLTLGVAVLFLLSYGLTNSWSFIPSVYLSRLLLPDLTPNVGLWWYFFIEMFDSFRAFFLGVFWLHMASYSPGLTIRLRTQPLAVVVLLWGIFTVFQPYANVGDAGAWIAMLTLYGHVFELTRYTFPAMSTLLYSTLLGPAFYYLWIYAGSGNANFFYAITLVWSLGLTVIVADMLYAILRDEWELERPEMKGKDVRQI